MKQSAFVFPITLFALLLIAGFSIAAFSLQQTHVNFLKKPTSSSSREIRVGKLSENSKVGAENIWQGIERQELILDGLYNLNHLVETTVLGGRQINSDQMLIFERVLEGCDINTEFIPEMVSYLLQVKTPGRKTSILDILASLSLTTDEVPRMLSCLRLASPLSKINFSFASAEMISSVLKISKGRSETLKQLMASGDINKKSELIAYFGSESDNLNLEKNLKQVIVRDTHEHAAVYWTEKNETFAFFDQSIDKDGAWKLNWNIVLWIPEIIK